ncbi:pyrophosphate-energized membrane proton pump, partial [Cymbomonas tetramitiformis]
PAERRPPRQSAGHPGRAPATPAERWTPRQSAGHPGRALDTLGCACCTTPPLGSASSISAPGHPHGSSARGLHLDALLEGGKGKRMRGVGVCGRVTEQATTKGFAIGSAGLASFLLFSAYMDEVSSFTGTEFKTVDIAIPEVWIGGLIGSMTVYLFSAFSCAAVGRSAQAVVQEVRLQFMQRPGIMTYQEKPDYARCVSIVAASALTEMIKPGVLAVGSPIAIGVLFRFWGAMTGQELLGARVVAGMLMMSTVAGILMALFLNNAGGAWDNAKKYVETGAFGGKGSEAHKAAVTGDTVGDPFKDTAGPSLHVLIKMLATITLVMAPLFLD